MFAIYYLKKNQIGVSWYLSRLRIQHCHCLSSIFPPQWPTSLLWLGFNPSPQECHMPWVLPQQKNLKTYKNRLKNTPLILVTHNCMCLDTGGCLESSNIFIIHLFIYLFIQSFQGHTGGIWRFPGQESNRCCSHQPMQCGIRAVSATYRPNT